MRNAMSDYWWTITIRGLVFVLLGVAAFVWPDITLQTMVILFGAFVFLDGLVNLSVATRARKVRDRWWHLLLQGMVGVGVGIVSLGWPALTAVALLYLVAFWAVAIGILEITAGVQVSRTVGGGWLLAVCGIGSMLFGASLIAWPDAALHGLIWLMGAGSVFLGSLLMFFGLKIRRIGFELNQNDFILPD